MRPNFARQLRLEIEGAVLPQEGSRECRTLDASAAACVLVVSTRVSHHGHTGNTRHSPRNGFNGLYRALLGDRAFLPPSLSGSLRQLDASVGASGPRVFAVRLSAVRQWHHRVHHIPPRVRDDRDTPLEWDGMAGDMPVIWVKREARYFCGQDWTGQISLNRLRKIDFGRTSITRLKRRVGQPNGSAQGAAR
jgi:hypothetical protein